MKHAANDGPDIAFRLARRAVVAVADDMSTVQRVVVGTVAALVGITPFGAWSELEAQAEPVVVGTPVEVGPFEVTIDRAATADELAYLRPQPGNRLLAVVAEVTNTGDVPEYAVTLKKAVPAPRDAGIVPLESGGTADNAGAAATAGAASTGRPDADGAAAGDAAPDETADSPAPGPADSPAGGSELPSASVFDIEDSTTLRVFNPGVTYEVALVWEQSGSWQGAEVPLDLVELDRVDEDPLSLDDGHWSAHDVAFTGTVPVKAAATEQGAR